MTGIRNMFQTTSESSSADIFSYICFHGILCTHDRSYQANQVYYPTGNFYPYTQYP